MLKTQECTEPFHGNGRDTQRTQVFVSHYTLKIVWILLQLIILPCSCPVLGMSSTNINPFFSHLSCAWHSFLDDDVKVLFNYFTYLWAPCNLVGVLELAERMQVGIYKFSIHSKSFFYGKVFMQLLSHNFFYYLSQKSDIHKCSEVSHVCSVQC